MTPIEARKLWAEALRSGEYEQGRLVLRSHDEKLCCLGVACEVYSEHVGHLERGVSSNGSACVTYKGRSSIPPPEVAEWLDITRAGALTEPRWNEDRSILGEALTGCNDSLLLTFDQIADIIEEPGSLKPYLECDIIPVSEAE